MAAALWRAASPGAKKVKGVGRRKLQTQAHVCQLIVGERSVQGGCSKKPVTPEDKKSMVETMTALGVSHRQACKETGLARTTQTYKAAPKKDEAVIEQLQALMEKFPA